MGRVFVLLLVGATGCASAAPAVPSPQAAPTSPPVGGASSSSPARSATAPPQTSSPELAASSNAAPGAPSAATTAPWPGVECDDATAAPNLRFFACTAACDRGESFGCETLG